MSEYVKKIKIVMLLILLSGCAAVVEESGNPGKSEKPIVEDTKRSAEEESEEPAEEESKETEEPEDTESNTQKDIEKMYQEAILPIEGLKGIERILQIAKDHQELAKTEDLVAIFDGIGDVTGVSNGRLIVYSSDGSKFKIFEATNRTTKPRADPWKRDGKGPIPEGVFLMRGVYKPWKTEAMGNVGVRIHTPLAEEYVEGIQDLPPGLKEIAVETYTPPTREYERSREGLVLHAGRTVLDHGNLIWTWAKGEALVVTYGCMRTTIGGIDFLTKTMDAKKEGFIIIRNKDYE